jgi:hypothetical protein
MLWERKKVAFVLEANVELILGRTIVKMILNKCEQIWIGTAFVISRGFIP